MNFRDLGIKDPNFFGRTRGNSYVQDNQLLKIESEDTQDVPVGLDIATISSSSGKSISEVTIDGITYTLSETVDATHTSKLKSVLKNTLEIAHAAARTAKTMTAQEIYTKVAVDYDGTDTKIYHLGSLTFNSLKEGANTINFARKTSQYVEGKFQITLAGAATVAVSDGTTSDNATYTNASTAISTITASLAAISKTEYGVEATVIPGGSDLLVTVYLEGADSGITFDGVAPTLVSVCTNFVI